MTTDLITAATQEQAVLGAMLNKNDVIPDVMEIITSVDYFNHDKHRRIFGAIVYLWDHNQIADIASVASELESTKKLDQVGGRTYLIDLSVASGDPINATYYAKDVRTAYVRREINRLGQRYAQDALSPTDDVSVLLDNFEQSIFDLQTQLIGSGSGDFSVVLSEELGLIDKRIDGELQGIKTGNLILDRKTTGFQNGDFIILAARPSKGKTALMLNWVKYMTKHGHKPLVFSLEMKQRQLAQRLICTEAMINGDKFRLGDINEDEKGRIGDAVNRLMKLPFIIDDTSGLTVTEMKARAVQYIRKEGVDCIFVDYLGLITAPKAENRQNEVSKISLGLKNMGQSLDVPVVCLSQLSRAVENRVDQRPMLSDLRDSGSIEQDADVVMFIWYPPLDKDEVPNDTCLAVDLLLAKQRNGSLGDIKLTFNKSIGLFTDRAE